MTQLKDTNPKDAIGIRKLCFSVLPWRVICRIALAMMEGAAKYGRHNYRGVGVRASVYFDAVVGRHLTSWWEGEDIDPDSGFHHVDKAIAGLCVLRDSMLQGNFVDDRPPRGNVDMDELNRMAAEILDRHADKNPYHYTIADTPDEAKRTEAAQRLGKAFEKLDALNLPPLSPEDVQAEIKDARKALESFKSADERFQERMREFEREIANG